MSCSSVSAVSGNSLYSWWLVQLRILPLG